MIYRKNNKFSWQFGVISFILVRKTLQNENDDSACLVVGEFKALVAREDRDVATAAGGKARPCSSLADAPALADTIGKIL